MRRISFVSLITFLLLLVVMPVVAQAGNALDEGQIPSLDGWLQEASGALVSVIVGFIISLLIDYWPAYQNMTTQQKRALFFGLCMVVPVSAACLRAVLGYVAWSFDPLLWRALWNGFAAGMAGTAVYVRAQRANRVAL